MGKSIEKIGRVTAASVLKCTGKNWDQWIAVLDKEGARSWPRKEIVAYLKKKHKLGSWWQQGVTYGYEVHTGRRVLGQTPKGEYSTVATRTFPIGKKKAWDLLKSKKGMALWLNPLSEFELKKGVGFEVYGGIFGEVRSIKPGEKLRLTWQEAEWPKSSTILVLVVARPKNKSVVIIQQEGLKSESLRLKMRTHWKEALSRLLSHCEAH